MEPPSIYSEIISPRSRRLRTIGIILLAAIVAMFCYGYFQLMPSMERSIREEKRISVLGSGQAHSLSRAQRVRKLKVATVMAYWGVCSLLLVGVFMVAWLDFREVTRVYVARRRTIWQQTAGAVESDEPRT